VKAAVRLKRSDRRSRGRETTESDRPQAEGAVEDGDKPRRRFWRRGSGGEGGNGGSEPTGEGE
jgi:hypothetical protein